MANYINYLTALIYFCILPAGKTFLFLHKILSILPQSSFVFKL